MAYICNYDYHILIILITKVTLLILGVLLACWLKCWPPIERLQVQAPLGVQAFFSPLSTPQKYGGVYHCIFQLGYKAAAPRELVNFASFLIKRYLIKSLVEKKSYIHYIITILYVYTGQERFRTISPSYYSGAHGIIVIYNTTDRESYTEVKHYWMKEIFGLFGDDADQKMPIMLIGTKADLIHGCCDDEQEVVRKRDVMELKKEHSRLLGPYECSAKTGKNIEKAFSRLVDDLVIRETIGIPKPDHPKPPKPCGMC